jgi:hypothetical protein
MARTSAWFGGYCDGYSGLPTSVVSYCGSEEGGG